MSNNMTRKVVVLGAGSFGTAIAYHLAKKYQNHPNMETVLYCRNPKTAQEINTEHTNKHYTGNLVFPKKLFAETDLAKAISHCHYLFLGVPAQAMRSVCASLVPHLTHPITIINLAKGIEVGTFKRMSVVIQEELAKASFAANINTLSGPAFARDILENRPIGVTLAGPKRRILDQVHYLMDTELFDIKITHDLQGVELGGALKNVFGIMAGMMEGLGMGHSISGDFLTRSIVDMKSIATYTGAKRATLDGRSGLGDLAITCTENSRNFRFGKAYVENFEKLQQQSPQEPNLHQQALEATFTTLDTRTVEGFYTLKPIYNFCSQTNMFVPIINELYRVLYQHTCTPYQAIHNYRLRDKIRIRETRLPLSRVLFFLFPRLWYRRETGWLAWLANKEDNRLLKMQSKRIEL